MWLTDVHVAKVQEYLAAKQELSQAIKSAIRYCRDNELMKEYFKEHEKEVLDVVEKYTKIAYRPELA